MHPATDAARPGDELERRFYLYPGGIWVQNVAGVITTILGSCVSVCLWDPLAGIGGINHFVLPHGGSIRDARYADHSLPTLLDKVCALPVRREHFVAAVFGGASVLAGAAGVPKLGARNVDAAREFLRRAGIAIVREDVGGSQGRKLTFRTADGSTVVRKI